MSNFKTAKKNFQELKDNVYQIQKSEEKPSKKSSLAYFFGNAGYSLKLIFQEKEIIVFALLQWAAIGAGYYLWVQMLDWIPDEVWKSAEDSDGASIVDAILLLWSFVCVGLVVYPLGIFTACMGASHFLRTQGQESTLASCLKIVIPRSWPLWIFSWIDGWWTVTRILERLPKKNDRTPRATKLINEAIYQSWKIASLGVMPALIAGRSVVDACKDSLGMVKYNFKDVALLRFGYSVICWFFGISCYIGTLVMLFFIDIGPDTKSYVYTFYFYAGIPIIVAVAFIQLFFRPIYIISSFRLYSRYIRENKIRIEPADDVSKGLSTLVAFATLAIIITVTYLYRDELGITELLSTVYPQK